MPSQRTPKPADMSHEDLESALLIELSLQPGWALLDERPDPDAVETYAMGWEINGRSVLVCLSRYEGEGDKYTLVSITNGKHGAITKDPIAIEWLWEQVTALVKEGSPDGS